MLRWMSGREQDLALETPSFNGAKKWRNTEHGVLQSSILTDEGAFGRLVIGVVEGGRSRESVFDALCKGNEGVADLDIAHALEDRL
jgi:hypothetical protein